MKGASRDQSSRRTFLRRGLFGGVALALSGVGLAMIPSAHVADPQQPLVVLDARSFQTLVAIARRVVDLLGPPIAGADKSAPARAVFTSGQKPPAALGRFGLAESAPERV